MPDRSIWLFLASSTPDVIPVIVVDDDDAAVARLLARLVDAVVVVVVVVLVVVGGDGENAPGAIESIDAAPVFMENGLRL